MSTNLNTVINLTNHSYFNLEGESSFPGSAYHQLSADQREQVHADRHHPIPLGYHGRVFGTPFDFTRLLTDRAPDRDVQRAELQLPRVQPAAEAQGYDHNWVLNPGQLRPGLGLNLAARASTRSAAAC